MGLDLDSVDVQSAPFLYDGLEFYYTAFVRLNTCRALGEFVAPIPWVSINEYAIRYDIEGQDFDDFFFFINGLDMAYIEWVGKKTQAK